MNYPSLLLSSVYVQNSHLKYCGFQVKSAKRECETCSAVTLEERSLDISRKWLRCMYTLLSLLQQTKLLKAGFLVLADSFAP